MTIPEQKRTKPYNIENTHSWSHKNIKETRLGSIVKLEGMMLNVCHYFSPQVVREYGLRANTCQHG